MVADRERVVVGLWTRIDGVVEGDGRAEVAFEYAGCRVTVTEREIRVRPGRAGDR